MKLFGTKMKVNICTAFVVGHLKRRWRNWGFSNFMYSSTYFESSRKTLIGHVKCLKGLTCITSVFGRSEVVHLG